MAQLKQRIGFFSGISITVGMIVGSGFFGLPGIIVEQSGPVIGFLGWLTVIVLVAPLVHIFSQLGLRYPSAEGVAKYAEIAFGTWAGYSFSLVACGALAIGMPAFFFVGGAYAAELFHLSPDQYAAPFALFLAIITTLFNLWGPEKFSYLGKIVVPFVLIFIIAIIVLYLPGRGETIAKLNADIVGTPLSINKLWLAAAVAFWAFQGWENMSFGLEEFSNPRKTIPLVYWYSFALISIIYALFAWTVSLVHYDGILVNGISGITSLINGGIFIESMVLLLIVGILIVNANSWVFGASRIAYSTAKKGILPRSMGELDKKSLPRNSLIGSLIIYSIIIGIIEFTNIPIHYAFLLTTQGFIFLYGTAIVAYFKVIKSKWKYAISAIAFLSWVFLISGFSWFLLYPVSLLFIGWWMYKRQGIKQA